MITVNLLGLGLRGANETRDVIEYDESGRCDADPFIGFYSSR